MEILDPGVVADGFARYTCHRLSQLRPNVHHPRFRTGEQVPEAYEDMAVHIAPTGYGQDTQIWTGSVYRTTDGMTALLWHTCDEDHPD